MDPQLLAVADRGEDLPGCGIHEDDRLRSPHPGHAGNRAELDGAGRQTAELPNQVDELPG